MVCYKYCFQFCVQNYKKKLTYTIVYAIFLKNSLKLANHVVSEERLQCFRDTNTFFHICQCKKLPIYRFVLLSGADTGTAAETGRFVEIADLAVLMLLVLAEHPCEG